jgi:HSP20 family molecular chaperone IbpA
MASISYVCRRKINGFFDKIDGFARRAPVYKHFELQESGFMNLGSKYVIRLNVGNFTKKNIKVAATPGKLIVEAAAKVINKTSSGNKTIAKKTTIKRLYKSYGLPSDVNLRKKTVSLKNGILTISIFKKKDI